MKNEEKPSIDGSTGSQEESFETWQARFLALNYGYTEHKGRTLYEAEMANQKRQEADQVARAREAAEEAKRTPKILVRKVSKEQFGGPYVHFSNPKREDETVIAAISPKAHQALYKGQTSFHLCLEKVGERHVLVLPDEVSDLEKKYDHPLYENRLVEVEVLAGVF